MKMLALLLLSSAVFAQTKTTKPTTPGPRPAIVSGRAFLITKGGDLKPARMASVYLFYSNQMPKKHETASDVARRTEDGDASMGTEFAKQAAAAATADLEFTRAETAKAAKEDYSESSEAWEKRKCHHTLMLTSQALQQTLQ